MTPSPGTVPEQTRDDLQLERLASFMAHSNYFKLSADELNALWTEDPAVIAHRQAVLRDILKHPELEEALDLLLGYIDGWEGRIGGLKRGLDEMAVGINPEIFSYLDAYIKKLDRVCEALRGISVHSSGINALLRQLEGMHGSERFAQVKAQFAYLCRGHVAPKRMRLGFNLDRALKPSRLKLLYMEPHTGEPDKRDKKRKLQLTQNAVDMSMLLLRRTVSGMSPSVTAFIMRETGELRSVKKDLIFYLSAVRLIRAWEEKGLSWCFPEMRPAEEKAFSVTGMFNPLLITGEREQIVSNDIAFHKGGEILIMTGANQGGKTVFLLSVALTQWLFQLGIAVPCKSASLSPVSGIYTVFAPSQSDRIRCGLLAEEAKRIAQVVNHISDNAMALFNEPLTSTSPSETKSISLDVIAAFKAAGVRGVWVTHIHELASGREKLQRLIPWGSQLGSVKVVLDLSGNESRFTYKVERAEPDFNSYAGDVLRRKGVAFRTEKKGVSPAKH
jgi:DNA mismatch repair ATPase MutS